MCYVSTKRGGHTYSMGYKQYDLHVHVFLLKHTLSEPPLSQWHSSINHCCVYTVFEHVLSTFGLD